ncbi:MAG: SRPBCC family protein [Balneolaceae bacterium]
MENIRVNGIINAPAQAVWEIVRDFGALHTYVEAVENCTLEKRGTETVRILTLADGAEVSERLEALDDEHRQLSYSIIESPLPVDNYLSVMEVKPKYNNASEFVWSSRFEVAEEAAEEIKNNLQGLYAMAVSGLRNKFS